MDWQSLFADGRFPCSIFIDFRNLTLFSGRLIPDTIWDSIKSDMSWNIPFLGS